MIVGCERKDGIEDILLWTRSDIIKLNPPDPNLPNVDRSRLYVEIDINHNGFEDIIISDDLYTGGNGGIMWNLYICVGFDQYRGPVAKIGGWDLAVEDDDYGNKRIWTYWRMTGNYGYIGYLFYDIGDGQWKVSPSLELHLGDNGGGLGSGVYHLIFNHDNLLPLKKISPASPTSDLPYVDEPWGR